MAERANITSVAAIAAFRTNLLIYLSKARPTLEEASAETTRVRLWLQTERRPHWERQLEKRMRLLEEVEAVLFGAKLSKNQEASAAQQAAVQKARRAVAEAEDKLRSIRRWDRDYENQTSPLVRQLEKLDTLLARDIPNAVAYLNDVIDTLEKYAALHAPEGAAAGPGGGAVGTGVATGEGGKA